MPDNQEIQILLRAQNQTIDAFNAARAEMKKLGDSSQQTNQLLGTLKSGLGALGIAFSATAVIGFAKEIVSAAGNVADLSAALGISTGAVQDFKQSAEDSGATIDDVGRAIQKLNDEAASNSDGFKRLGLDIDAVLKLSPEDRFRAVANALKDIKDPAERAARGHDLLGKSYDALAASIENGIGSMSDSNKMSEETIKTLDDLGDSIGHLLTSIKNFGGKVIATAVNDFNHMISETGKAFTATRDAGDKFFAKLGIDAPKARQQVADLWEMFKILRDGVQNMPKVAVPSIFGGEGPTGPKKLTPDDIKGIENALNAERKALDEAAKAADKHTEKIRALREELSGKGAIKAAQDMVTALKGIATISPAKIEQVNKTMAEALDVLNATGQGASKTAVEIRKLYQETFRLTDTIPLIKRWGDSIADATREYIPLKSIAEKLAHETWPKTIDGLERMLILQGQITVQTKTLGQSLKENLVKTLEQIPQTIVDAFTGGGGAGGAIKAIGSTVGSAIGAAVAGPIGAAVGSLLGPAITGLGKLLGIGPTEYEKRMRAAAEETKNLQRQLLASHGSMQQLIIDADLVGINIKEAFKWNDPEAFKKIVGEINDKTTLLNSAMQEYGFTWEDLGERARGAQLEKLFDDLFAKTDILRTAGIDYHTILERQADDYSKLVQAAIRTGTEIPEAMRPVLIDLMDMGKLVDENGDALTDLNDIKWAKTMTDGFKDVTDAIHELTDALVNGVGGALDDLGRRKVKVPVEFDVNPGGAETPEHASGAYIRRDHIARVHAGEIIGPRDFIARALADAIAAQPATAGGGGHFTIQASELPKFLRGEIISVTRADAARGGLRTRTPSGRSY